MADYQARIAPFIDTTFYLTSIWWEEPRNHRGLDIATPNGSPLYSMSDGVVILSEYSTSYGYMLIIKDSNNMGFLYAHMREQSPLSVGDTVEIGQYIGFEGATGEVTGIHLHLEMQDLTNHNWLYGADKSYYTNPTEYMGIPNIEGISIYYDGEPKNEPSKPHKLIKKKFKWVLFAHRIRKNNQKM